MREQCKEQVYPRESFGSFHPSQCKKKVWKDGYCKQHHPETVKKRSDESDRRYKERLENSPFRKIEKLTQQITDLRAENDLLKEDNERLLKADFVWRNKYGMVQDDLAKAWADKRELVKSCEKAISSMVDYDQEETTAFEIITAAISKHSDKTTDK
jgi:hypothetical protein